MKIKINLSKFFLIKIEGVINVSGVLTSIAADKILETLKGVQLEHNLKGTVQKE